MGRKCKTDIGKRAIYNFHVNNDTNNRKVSPIIVDCWYPATPRQTEVLILSKMSELSKGRDGVPVRITQNLLPSLFMTGCYTQTKDGQYVADEPLIWQQTRSRYQDFVDRKLMGGTLSAPTITFSGLRQLDDMVTIDNSAEIEIRELVASLRKNIDEMQQQSVQLEKLVEILNEQMEKPEKSKGEIVSNMANIATIIGTIPTVLSCMPGIKNVMHHLLECIGR